MIAKDVCNRSQIIKIYDFVIISIICIVYSKIP